MEFKLSKNEKTVLKLLIENSKTTDSEIANKLNITSQAVGKIRKRLEDNIIDSYSVNLKYEKLNIKMFAIAIAKITSEGLEKGHLEVESKLLNENNIIQIFRLPRGNETHLMIMGFNDITQLDDYYHSASKINEIHKYIQTKKLYTMSHNSMIKNNPKQLFNMIINQNDTNNPKNQLKEITDIKL